MPQGLFPVGRLDRDTTGALLFTTDGDLASAVLRPDHALEKEYWLWLNEPLTASDARLSLLLEGLPLLGAVARASRVSLLSTTEDMSELLVFLQEGKNRQIRRMCRAIDLRLLHLHRRAIGSIRVDDLPMGAHRALHAREVLALYAAVGGRDAIRARQCAALERTARKLRAEDRPDLRLEAWLDDRAPIRRGGSPSEEAACTPP
jgi:pseudouridine synthase